MNTLLGQTNAPSHPSAVSRMGIGEYYLGRRSESGHVICGLQFVFNYSRNQGTIVSFRGSKYL